MITTPRIQRRKRPGFLLFLALVSLLLGGFLLMYPISVVTTYTATPGTETVNCVTDPNGDSDAQNDCSYSIDVTYQVNGKTFDDNFNALPMVFSSPAQVTVLYNPQAPQEEQVASFANLWLWPYVTLFIGLFFLALVIARININRLIARKEAEWAGVPITGYLY